MKRIPCYLEYDERTATVTMRHAKTNCIQMMVKLEAGSKATMERVTAYQDCDNFWIGVKPGDAAVAGTRGNELFGNKHLVVNEINFELR